MSCRCPCHTDPSTCEECCPGPLAKTQEWDALELVVHEALVDGNATLVPGPARTMEQALASKIAAAVRRTVG